MVWKLRRNNDNWLRRNHFFLPFTRNFSIVFSYVFRCFWENRKMMTSFKYRLHGIANRDFKERRGIECSGTDKKKEKKKHHCKTNRFLVPHHSPSVVNTLTSRCLFGPGNIIRFWKTRTYVIVRYTEDQHTVYVQHAGLTFSEYYAKKINGIEVVVVVV